jgi:hypothetical protein
VTLAQRREYEAYLGVSHTNIILRIRKITADNTAAAGTVITQAAMMVIK